MKGNNPNFLASFSFMSILTLISRILGYVRDLFFAFILGATPVADSFLLAFRIPNFLEDYLRKERLKCIYSFIFIYFFEEK